MKIEYRTEDTISAKSEDLDNLIKAARNYKTKLTLLKTATDNEKAKVDTLLNKLNIKSITADKVSVSWSPPSKQKRISRDRVIETLTNHGVPVDAIEDCYEEYDRKEVITIKSR